MKALVAYFSQTGNTKKVAEVICEEIQCEKAIKSIEEIDSVDDYDFIFVGFPIQAFGPAQQGKEFLENKCRGKKVALFMTHAVPEDFEGLAIWLAACRESAAGADVAGMFDCQGALDDALLEVVRSSDDPEFRKLAEVGATSKGQPDATRLDRARVCQGNYRVAQTAFTKEASESSMTNTETSPKKGMTIAVTGKGGSGKTTLSDILTGLLARKDGLDILAIDADSAINLPYALGIEIGQTVSEVRNLIISDPEARAEINSKPMQKVMEESLEKGSGFSSLVMGRPEGPGCFCAINNLLRYGIEALSKQFDITLIDCEAGPEQVNRRVISEVDFLIIVTDASIRSTRVAGSIMDVIQKDDAIRPGYTGLVINKLKGDDKLITDCAAQWGLEILGRIPDDELLAEYDAKGRPIIDLPDTSPSVQAVKKISEMILSNGIAE